MEKPQYNLSIKVLKKALTKEQFEKLMKMYLSSRGGGKHGNYWMPTSRDLEMYHSNPRPTVEEWSEHWGVQEQTVYRRLGKVYLIENEDGKEIDIGLLDE